MEDLRQKLLAAKKKIEAMSGYKFKPDSIALADLISEFMAIKIEDKLKVAAPVSDQSVFGTQETKDVKDTLYGD